MLDPFYPIVDDAQWLDRLLPAGVRLVQLRLKDRAPAEIAAQIRRARDLCADAGAQLVVNDHWEPALDAGCDFVHLGQEDLAAADLPALRAAGCRVGISTHDHAELRAALAADPAYVALGPIHPTRLKEMPWAPQGVERITEWKRLIGRRPLVAIGGLTPERGVDALRSGADVVAVVSDLLLHPDPVARAWEWIEVTRTPSTGAVRGERS